MLKHDEYVESTCSVSQENKVCYSTKNYLEMDLET